MSRDEREHWPIHPITGQPMPPRAQPGYYPGHSTLAQAPFWDDATRKVVMQRVREVPPIRFFSPEEARQMQAVIDRVLPQFDRDLAHRIPILPSLDQRLFERRTDGTRYQGMPPDWEAHRLGLRGIEAIARHLHRISYIECGGRAQDEVLQTIHHGQPPAGAEIWKQMPSHRYWLLLVKECVEIYYAHPFAWDEIGYGGPAYPRGYMRLEHGEPEPWEVSEQRYEWRAPESALSGGYVAVGGSFEHLAPPGQGGTH